MSVLGLIATDKQRISTWMASYMDRVELGSPALFRHIPDSKVHGANMRPIWGR